MSDPVPVRRADDGGPLCWLVRRASEAWDFIDKRDIDKHAVSVAILYGTVRVTTWAMDFAQAHPTDSALTIAAVGAPYMALQAAAIAWYFKARGGA